MNKKIKKIKIVRKEVLREPEVSYGLSNFRFFESVQDQENYELEQLAKLSSNEILLQLRRFINLAFGMHGYDSNKLPSKHSIKIIKEG